MRRQMPRDISNDNYISGNAMAFTAWLAKVRASRFRTAAPECKKWGTALAAALAPSKGCGTRYGIGTAETQGPS